MPNPVDLFVYIARAEILSAWNCAFEFWVWHSVARSRLGWPALPWWQLSDNMPNLRAHGYPGKLLDAAAAIGSGQQKDTEGKRLIKKFCVPRNPTKNDPRRRILPIDEPVEAQKLYDYCLQDIATESAVGSLLPPLSPTERRVFRTDQAINARGIHIDQAALADCVVIVDQATRRYTEELTDITQGAVDSVGKVQALASWLRGCDVHLPSLDKIGVAEALAGDLEPVARRALEIRQLLSNSSVKKVYAIQRRLTPDGRLHDLFAFHGADRTGRWAGRGPQPQNLPPSGDEHILNDIATRSLDHVEALHGCAFTAVSGCLRQLFTAAPGYDLICSDYSAIEAVILAALAGEQWRLDLFNGHGRIYEQSASLITGIPIDEMIQHKTDTGEHHPARKIGKVGELASGYQGGVNAWRQFGATGTDDDVLLNVRKWRKANPHIVDFWYAVQRCTVAAIKYPGTPQKHRGIDFFSNGKTLSIRLLSGRCLHYQRPALIPDTTPWGKSTERIVYYGHRHVGGWQQIDTYGGSIVENITQATARDILAGALVGLDNSGYPVVLHVHDEPVSEVPAGFGSLPEYESIMCGFPDWCRNWPIKADGGWRGLRYRK